jgi:hypothetical protein
MGVLNFPHVVHVTPKRTWIVVMVMILLLAMMMMMVMFMVMMISQNGNAADTL